MTQPPPVRAVARVGAQPAPPPGPATLVPRRRPGTLGPVHVVQLLVVEAAVLGALAALGSGPLVLAPVAVVALALLLVALARRRGRWLLERWMLRRWYRQRGRSGPGSRPADVRLALLRYLAPRLTVEDVTVTDDTVVGVARDDAGWFAVAEIAPKAAMADPAGSAVPLDRLVAALRDADEPGAALQVVTHTLCAPSLDLAPALPSAYSYRDLLQRFGPVPIPVERITWVCVRLDARVLAEAGARDAEHAPAMVAALLRRLVKVARRGGATIRALDRDGLLAALTRSCDLERPDETAPLPVPREEWRAWHSAGLAHRCYWVRDWPSVTETGALVDWVASAPAAQTSVAFVAVPDVSGPDTADVRCLVRVAAPAAQLDEVCAAVERGAAVAKAKLFALDGEQVPAVYASAPTGGGPR